VPWRARTIVQRQVRWRARRPQLKRDPLGRDAKMTHPRSHSLLILLVTTAPAAAAGQSFDFTTRVSLATVERKAPCTSLPDSNLAPGTPITLVYVPVAGTKRNPKILSGTVEQRLTDEACSPDIGRYGGSFYRVAVADRGDVEGPVFLLLKPHGPLSVRGRTVMGDVDGDRVPEQFRVCTSNEGLHFTIWSGQPLQSKLRFHQYFPLRYEVVLNCTDADYAEP